MWNCMLASHCGYFPLSTHSARSLVGTRVNRMCCIWLMRITLTLAVVFRQRSEHSCSWPDGLYKLPHFSLLYVTLGVFLCKLHSILFECVLAHWYIHIEIRIWSIHSSVVVGNEFNIYVIHLTGKDFKSVILNYKYSNQTLHMSYKPFFLLRIL